MTITTKTVMKMPFEIDIQSSPARVATRETCRQILGLLRTYELEEMYLSRNTNMSTQSISTLADILFKSNRKCTSLLSCHTELTTHQGLLPARVAYCFTHPAKAGNDAVRFPIKVNQCVGTGANSKDVPVEAIPSTASASTELRPVDPYPIISQVQG